MSSMFFVFFDFNTGLMNRYTFALILSSFIHSAATKAQELGNIIRQMPDTIIPTLSKNNVLDFVDYQDSKMKAVVTNNLGYKSEMTTLTTDYAFIRTSSNSDIQIKLLPLADSSKIVSLVHTVTCDSINADSRIEFYTTDWKPLSVADYFSFNDKENFSRYILSPDDTSILVRFTNPLEPNKDVKPRESIILKWNGKKYE